MADKTHLDELIAQQTDPAAKRLLEEFGKLVRDPLSDPSEYAAALRKVMDTLFTEAVDAPANPDGQ
jgi:hypothetical protein